MQGRKRLLISLAAAITINGSLFAQDKENSYILDTVDVTTQTYSEDSSSYTIKSMSTATRMDLDVIDTPQSIAVLTTEQMKDFGLNNINKAVNSISGVNVDDFEPGRTVFFSRGFHIKNFLVDGVAFPLGEHYKYGDEAMNLYDRIEVTKGATGLTSAHGKPSATINLVRKKPTAQTRGSVKLSAGSWDYRRLDLDVSGALNEAKTTRARLIASKKESDSYLDRREDDALLYSGIIEHDISDDALIRVGFSQNKEKIKGVPWGGLPATYSDGSQTNFDISTNAAPDWGHRDVTTTDAFLEIEKVFTNDWKLKTTYAYKRLKNEALMAMLAGSPDRKTGVGTNHDFAMDYLNDSKQHLLDITLDGEYELLGREHNAVFGLNLAKRKLEGGSAYDRTSNTAINLFDYNGDIPKRVYDDSYSPTDYEEKLNSFLFATNLNLSDSFNLLIGSKLTNWKSSGEERGGSMDSEDKNVFTPYAGLVYKITDDMSTYVSYATSFSPQPYADANQNLIDPADGTNYEIGFKSRHFNGKLNTSIALFRTEYDNYAEWAGWSPTTGAFYSVSDGVVSKGYEIEVSGAITNNLDINMGYTHFSLKNEDNNSIEKYQPRKLFKAALTYKPDFVKGLKLGTALRYKGKITNDPETVSQSALTIVDLMANYNINKNWNISFNIDNVTDKKHFGSLEKGRYVSYAEPRRVGVSLEYKF